MRTLNLGILAHVDAGKTSLTERLLYAAGVIDEIGSVDDGSTQTDSLALERRRGITIKSAVVSFAIGDVTVNLIDTPGHPDFIAEVERVLSVLDGAVLVVSAVEGVQAQTRVLMRALRRLRRADAHLRQQDRPPRRRAEPRAATHRRAARIRGRRDGRRRPAWARGGVVAPVRRRRPPGSPRALVDVLAEHDDALLAAYVDGAAIPYARLRARARRADRARRGAPGLLRLGDHRRGRRRADRRHRRAAARRGADARRRRRPAPSSRSSAGRPARRSPTSGCSPARCATRDRLARRRQGHRDRRVRRRRRGAAPRGGRGADRQAVGARRRPHRRRDRACPRTAPQHRFAPPTLETIVTARRPGRPSRAPPRAHRARRAGPADQPAPGRARRVAVSLYGEVQKEVIERDAGRRLRHRRSRSARPRRSASSGRSAPAPRRRS